MALPFEKKNEIELYHKAQLLNGTKKLLELFIDNKIEVAQVLVVLKLDLHRYCVVLDREWNIERTAEESMSEGTDDE